MEIIFELLVAIIQPIVSFFFEMILMIFYFFVKKFPRLGIAFLLGVVGLLSWYGYLMAAGLFAAAAFILLGLYIKNRKK